MARLFTQAVPAVGMDRRFTLETLNQLNQVVDALGGVDGAFEVAGEQITSGTIPAARIPEAAVTQHQAAITLTATQVQNAGPTFPTTSITSGVFANARIAASNVTQHEGALTLTGGQVSAAGGLLTSAIGSTVHRFLSVRESTGTSATLAATDSILIATNGSANTVTIPASLTGGPFFVFQGGAGTTTVQGASGVDLNDVTTGTLAISAQYAWVFIARRAANDWLGG